MNRHNPSGKYAREFWRRVGLAKRAASEGNAQWAERQWRSASPQARPRRTGGPNKLPKKPRPDAPELKMPARLRPRNGRVSTERNRAKARRRWLRAHGYAVGFKP